MKKILITTTVMVFLLMACTVMAMGRRPSGNVVVTIPALPSIVVMDLLFGADGFVFWRRAER